jgi:peptidoglycan/LPS O-acetylase OafA/YrhL
MSTDSGLTPATAQPTPEPIRGPRLGHRPALDGLRGVAILMVISVHIAGAHYFPGGAFGVDVFFVLSGFLITRLLIEEHRDTGRVSLRAFYGRRALRLLPALLIVLTFVAIAPRVLSGVGTVGHLVNLRDVLGPLLYVYNWVLIAYFNTPMMMTHAWSRAVE